MQYSVFQINSDGSAALLSQFPDLDSAQSFIASQGPGEFRIEFGDSSVSTIISIVSQ